MIKLRAFLRFCWDRFSEWDDGPNYMAWRAERVRVTEEGDVT